MKINILIILATIITPVYAAHHASIASHRANTLSSQIQIITIKDAQGNLHYFDPCDMKYIPRFGIGDIVNMGYHRPGAPDRHIVGQVVSIILKNN